MRDAFVLGQLTALILTDSIQIEIDLLLVTEPVIYPLGPGG